MDSNRTVIITGANGFIGSYLREFLSYRNFNVIGFVRSPKSGSNDIQYEISKPVNEAVISQAAAVIHCAYIAETDGNSSAERNVSGTINLINACRKHNVRLIFFSSLSAHPQATSSYGRHKYEIEQLLDLERDVIVQPGLVIGDGGLFLKMLKFARKFRVVPLIDGGRQPLQYIWVGDVAAAVNSIVVQQLSGKFVLVSDTVSYREFYQAIAKTFKTRIYFVPAPVNAILSVLSFAEKLKLPLPVNAENLRGLKNMRYIDPQDSMKKAGVEPLPLEEALRSYSL